MDLEKRLHFFFLEAEKHIEKIQKAKEVLIAHYPLDAEKLMGLDEHAKDKLDVLVFRFAKLQDLMGEKIFRTYLEWSGVGAQKPFLYLLAHLEREGVLEVDAWREMRNARNEISHEYPYNDENIAENVNKILEYVDTLIRIEKRLERIVHEIDAK